MSQYLCQQCDEPTDDTDEMGTPCCDDCWWNSCIESDEEDE